MIVGVNMLGCVEGAASKALIWQIIFVSAVVVVCTVLVDGHVCIPLSMGTKNHHKKSSTIAFYTSRYAALIAWTLPIAVKRIRIDRGHQGRCRSDVSTGRTSASATVIGMLA